MTDAETLDVQMMQETIKKLTLENDKWKANHTEQRIKLERENAARVTYQELIDSVIERLVNK